MTTLPVPESSTLCGSAPPSPCTGTGHAKVRLGPWTRCRARVSLCLPGCHLGQSPSWEGRISLLSLALAGSSPNFWPIVSMFSWSPKEYCGVACPPSKVRVWCSSVVMTTIVRRPWGDVGSGVALCPPGVWYSFLRPFPRGEANGSWLCAARGPSLGHTCPPGPRWLTRSLSLSSPVLGSATG